MNMLDLQGLIRGEVLGHWQRVWEVRERLPFMVWCERNIVIGTGENRQHAGKYRREPVHSMSRLYEEFLDSDEWRELTIQKGSQAAATSHALMAMLRYMEEMPGNVVYVIHSQDEAKNISDRFKEFAWHSEAGAKMLEGMDPDDNKVLKIKLPGGTIWFTGAQSAGTLASKPGVVLVVNDEVNKHKDIKGETSSMNLLRSRIKADDAAKMLGFSSPTDEKGQITVEVMAGSRHRDFLPCPHCGEMQWLKPGRLRYEHCKDLAGEYDLERVLLETRYACSGCGKEIEEIHKPSMLAGGEWRATNFKKSVGKVEGERDKGVSADLERMVPMWIPGRMSALTNDLYATWGKSTWGHIAVEAIKARGDRKAMHDLKNNRYGEAFARGGAAAVTAADIEKLKGAYLRGSVMYEPSVVIFGADTQGDCWKWVMCGFRENGDCMFSDWGMSLNFKDMMIRAKNGVEYEGKNYMAKFCLVDEGGNRTREVRKNVHGLSPWFNACKGLGGIQVRTTLEWRNFDVDKEDEGMGKQVRVLVYDDDGFKLEMYKDMIYKAARAGTKDAQAALLGSKRMYFPVDLDEVVVNELCSEREVDGKWKTHGPNDFGDALKECIIGHAAIGHAFK